MSNVRVVNKMPAFKRSLYNVLGDAMREAARDIVVVSRNRAPYDKGGLRNEPDPIVKKGDLHYWVQYTAKYARFQEFGGDGKRTVRNYTTSGTGKRFLKTAGDEQTAKLKMTIRKHTARARA